MKLSEKGRALLVQREGSRATMYLDSAKLPTIGVGHLLTRDELSSGKVQIGAERVRWKDGLTAAQIDTLLAQDVAPVEAAVDRRVLVGMHQWQFDALVSFVFNIGVGAFIGSTLLRRLNARDYAGAQAEFGRWVFAGGKRVAGLAKRRASEARQFAGEEV